MRPQTPKQVADFYGLWTGDNYMLCSYCRPPRYRASHYLVGADLVVCHEHALANKHATVLLYDEEAVDAYRRRKERERRRQDRMREEH